MAVDHIDLAPGKYVLTENVENPHPDRRQKYDWRAKPVWEKGTRFIVVQHEEKRFIPKDLPPEVAAKLDPMIRYRTIHKQGGYTHQRLPLYKPRERDDHEAFQVTALVEKLQFVPTKSLGELFADEKESVGVHNALEVIGVMLDHELLSIEDVAKAAKILYDMDEDAFNDLRKRHDLTN